MSEYAVEVVDLTKRFGDFTAVDGVTFHIKRGEIFGFLGPNGAGKTTTMKVLSTLLRKTSGRVTVAGHDVDSDPKAVRRSIGFAMQEVGLDDLATGRDFLLIQGVLYGLSRREARGRADELLAYVGLAGRADDPVKTFSRGMVQRVSIARALVHDPDLLLADEPFAGLDAPSRRMLEEMLGRLHGEGRTIVLASHDLAQPGETLTYTLHLENVSWVADVFFLVDPLPEHTTYLPASLSFDSGQGSYDAERNQITWSGTLPAVAGYRIGGYQWGDSTGGGTVPDVAFAWQDMHDAADTGVDADDGVFGPFPIGFEFDLYSLGGQYPLKAAGQLAVNGGQQMGQHLDHRHLGPQGVEDRGELDTDHPAAHDGQTLR